MKKNWKSGLAGFLVFLLIITPTVLNGQSEKRFINKYLTKLPSFTMGKELQRYRMTAVYTNRDLYGNFTGKTKVTGDYTKGLENGQVKWNSVIITKSNSYADAFPEGVIQEYMENMTYIPSSEMLKAEAFRNFPSNPENVFARNLIWDMMMIEDFAWRYSDSLKLNQKYVIKNIKGEFDMADIGTYNHNSIQMCWTGISEINNVLCAVIEYRAIDNIIELSMDQIKTKGTEQYWGTTWVDQKRITSHLMILILSLLVVIFNAFIQKNPLIEWMQVVFFIWFIIQIEVFLFIARLVFGRFEQGKTRGQITRRALSRFMFFYLACLIAAFAIYLLLKVFISYQTGETYRVILHNFFKYEFTGWFKSTTGGLVFGGVIFLAVLWQDALTREQKLKEENLIFQNETLKSQINPHFLFNSLNTISSLIQSQPEIAENFINNLSSFYRYILENGQKKKVSLESELNFLREYFNMHKVRDENKIFLNIGPVETGEYEILPVSLQILLENAVKHNISTRENPLSINVYLEDQYIVIKNNLQRKATQVISTGIGLRNLAERISLAQNRELVIEETKSEFVVKVPLIL